MTEIKKVLIKVTNNSEFTSSSGELVTLTALIDMLKAQYLVRYYGVDDNLSATAKYQLENKIKNKFQKKIFRKLFSIPITLINSYYIVRILRPDLIMCIGGVYYNGLCILIIGKIFRIPTLVRTAEDHYRVSKLQDNLIQTLKHKLIILPISHVVLKLSDHVLTVGRSSKKYLARILKRDVLYCPSPILLNESNVDNINRDIKILYVGTLNRVKGSHELNKFLRQALTRDSKYNFTFVGSDKSPQKFIQNIANDFPNQVSIYPPIKNEELIRFYRRSEFLIFTTKVGIGYGLVTLEAKKQGCRVIAIHPRLDVKSLHTSHTVEEAVEALSGIYVKTDQKIHNAENITQAHLNIFGQLL